MAGAAEFESGGERLKADLHPGGPFTISEMVDLSVFMIIKLSMPPVFLKFILLACSNISSMY